MKLIEVTFIKSPTGAFGLAYNAGQVGYVDPEMAKKMEDAGYIERLPAARVEEAVDQAAEQRETRPGRGGKRKKS